MSLVSLAITVEPHNQAEEILRIIGHRGIRYLTIRVFGMPVRRQTDDFGHLMRLLTASTARRVRFSYVLSSGQWPRRGPRMSLGRVIEMLCGRLPSPAPFQHFIVESHAAEFVGAQDALADLRRECESRAVRLGVDVAPSSR